ncbi:A/G-specific adenine glycosylase [Chloroflexi bacterium TSY]|nr:A/G-specific adenine glycosylase [Chloroflexi bacterium TSY]
MQRSLPWRIHPAGQRDAYAVWISEIMAQQTRLEVVVGYYERWMERFPTVNVLADADLQDVLKLWEGLGYYARARNLHKAARLIVEQYNSILPNDRKTLLSLPGIGEYTVGAILSMAYGQVEPVLDGNVKRVLSRVFDIEESIDERETLKQLWTLSHDLVAAAPQDQAGQFNEALMELGAILCTPTSPKCLLCPVADHCCALTNGTQHERPVKAARKKTPYYDVAAGVIWQGHPFQSKLLIAQRPADGMLGGLWEFPGGKQEANDPDLQSCLQREIQEELRITIKVGEKIAEVPHAYTHFRITLHAFHAQYVDGEPESIGVADWRWVTLEELANYPFPVTDRKVIKKLGVVQN